MVKICDKNKSINSTSHENLLALGINVFFYVKTVASCHECPYHF